MLYKMDRQFCVWRLKAVNKRRYGFNSKRVWTVLGLLIWICFFSLQKKMFEMRKIVNCPGLLFEIRSLCTILSARMLLAHWISTKTYLTFISFHTLSEASLTRRGRMHEAKGRGGRENTQIKKEGGVLGRMHKARIFFSYFGNIKCLFTSKNIFNTLEFSAYLFNESLLSQHA